MVEGALSSFFKRPTLKTLMYLIARANEYWYNHGSDSP